MKGKTSNENAYLSLSLSFLTQCLPRHPADPSRLGTELINADYSPDTNWKVHWLPLCLSFPTYNNITNNNIKKTLLNLLHQPPYFHLKGGDVVLVSFCFVFYL